MAIVVLGSVSGAPGVTTLAVGLALAWPRSVVLADCDPGAHQAVLAGFLAGQSSDGKGLLRVAEAHRDRRPLTEVILDQTLPLVTDGDHQRHFLPGFNRPGSAAIFAGVWADLVAAFDALGDIGVDVVVDAGRLGPRGLPAPLADAAAFTGLVVRSDLRAVVSAQVHLPVLVEDRRNHAGDSRLGLIVVGEGRPYSAREIGRALAVRVTGTIPWDPSSAGHLSDGRDRARRFDTSAFARALHTTATDLSDRLELHAELIGGRS
ncbi:MAG TPA: hypothetical protein VIT42_02045 [Microlunatus sp.]